MCGTLLHPQNGAQVALLKLGEKEVFTFQKNPSLKTVHHCFPVSLSVNRSVSHLSPCPEKELSVTEKTCVSTLHQFFERLFPVLDNLQTLQESVPCSLLRKKEALQKLLTNTLQISILIQILKKNYFEQGKSTKKKESEATLSGQVPLLLFQ